MTAVEPGDCGHVRARALSQFRHEVVTMGAFFSDRLTCRGNLEGVPRGFRWRVNPEPAPRRRRADGSGESR